jgi:hypothetical protein
MSVTITIEGDAKESLVAHIVGLQAALTERNKSIERLQAEVDAAREGAPSQDALREAYNKGWWSAMRTVDEALSGAGRALGAVRINFLASVPDSEGEL